MKKNTVRSIVVFSMIGFVGFAQNGQTARRAALKSELEQADKLRKEKVAKIIAEKGLPLTINKDGKFSQLIDVAEDGSPVYISTSNAGSARTSRSNRVYPGGSAGLSLTGAGVRAGVWDGSAVRTTHITFSGRVSNMDTSSETMIDHPTHVTGTVVGNGGSNASARGIAYEGNVWSYDWNSDTVEMVEAAESIVASNHSYGLNSAQSNPPVSVYGKYDNSSRAVDAIAYEYPYYQIVFAAGNDRDSYTTYNPTKGGYDLLTREGVAKNILTVAACREVSNYDAINPWDVELASFTNFGPTDDYRIKPDITTKGVNVLSSVLGNGSSNTTFASESGTSMAAPGITGVIMLLQQHYSNLHPSEDPDMPNYMRSASVRGLFAHTADQIGEMEGPTASSGWGLVNAEKAANILTAKDDNTGTVIFDERTLQQGGTYTFTVQSDDVSKLTASISWTDPAGTVAGNATDQSTPKLVNNLELRVTSVSTGQVIFPWRLSNTLNAPVALRDDNNVDNLEKVEVEESNGKYTVTVSHDGSLSGGSQDYTLIVTGITGGILSEGKVEANALMVYPNPANDVVNISLANEAFASGATAIMYDIQGRQVLSKNLSGTEASLNVAGLSAGVYFIKLNNNGKEQVKKLVVK